MAQSVGRENNQTHSGAVANTSSKAIVDIAASLRRMGNSRELFGDVVTIYEEDSPGLLARIRGAVREADADRLQRAAHSLKGLVSNFGAAAATEAAYALETMAIQRDLNDSVGALQRLEHELQRLSKALEPFASDKLRAVSRRQPSAREGGA